MIILILRAKVEGAAAQVRHQEPHAVKEPQPADRKCRAAALFGNGASDGSVNTIHPPRKSQLNTFES